MNAIRSPTETQLYSFCAMTLISPLYDLKDRSNSVICFFSRDAATPVSKLVKWAHHSSEIVSVPLLDKRLTKNDPISSFRGFFLRKSTNFSRRFIRLSRQYSAYFSLASI